MNTFTIADQVALSRAFAKYSLARVEVQRDVVLTTRLKRKVETLDRIVSTLNQAPLIRNRG